MAWVQLGSRKINTALVCYFEQEDEKSRLHFTGHEIPLELQPDEAQALWKFLKAENLLGVKDKGSTMVLPKRWSAAPPDAVPANGTPAKPLQVATPTSRAPAGAPKPAQGQPKPHSSGHGHSSSHHHPSSHSSSSHRSSSHPQPSSSQHRSSSHGHSSSSSSSSPKPTDTARVLDFKKE